MADVRKTIWSLCLLCLAAGFREAEAAPAKRTGSMAAPQEEVNVLMFGVIQFSESLSYVYESTEAKIAKIIQTLRSHEGTLQKLGRQTEQAAEVENQIKEVIHMLQAQTAKQQAQTRTTKDRLARMQQEEEQLKTKVTKLETHLDTNMSIKELRERAEEQSNILKGLQHLTQFHKERMESQNEQLSKLQRMSEDMTLLFYESGSQL